MQTLKSAVVYNGCAWGPTLSQGGASWTPDNLPQQVAPDHPGGTGRPMGRADSEACAPVLTSFPPPCERLPSASALLLPVLKAQLERVSQIYQKRDRQTLS